MPAGAPHEQQHLDAGALRLRHVVPTPRAGETDRGLSDPVEAGRAAARLSDQTSGSADRAGAEAAGPEPPTPVPIHPARMMTAGLSRGRRSGDLSGSGGRRDRRRQGEAPGVRDRRGSSSRCDGVPDGPVHRSESFLDPLVARLSAQHGLDPRAVRDLAVRVLASFAGARVRAFVPILVEKRLRETCRGRAASGTIPAAHAESTAAVAMTAVAGPAVREGAMALVPPGFRAFSGYRRRWLVKDLVAGVVLTTLLVPQGMAYAELAGLPPITGLYTTIMCLLAYAVFGPSRILVLGPDSSLGPMIAATILPLVAAGGDPGAGRRARLDARSHDRGRHDRGGRRSVSASSPTCSPSRP